MKSLKDKIQRQVHNKIYNQVYNNTILRGVYNIGISDGVKFRIFEIVKKIDQIFYKTYFVGMKIQEFKFTGIPEIMRIKRKIFRHVTNSTLTDPKDLV